MRKRILILSHDKIGDKMAGPGIRYHNLAKELRKHFDVTVGVYNPDHVFNSKVYVCRHMDVHKFQSFFDSADVIIALWMSAEMIAYAKSKNKLLVFDLYAPVPAEMLVNKYYSGNKLEASEDKEYLNLIEQYRSFFKFGDLFLCSNYRQKDFWAGFAFASHAVIPSSYDSRPLHSRIIEAPMGIDESSPKHTKTVLRGVVNGINNDDFIIIWTGGVWDWFDGQTVVRAMGKITNPKIKLVFLGTKNPNADVPLMRETKATIELAKELKLFGKNVFFLDGWLGYEERIDYLLEADSAIYAHKDSIETRYSHRTRCLDHIYARIPTIATEGDYFAEIIEKNELGLVTAIGDIDGIASSIDKVAAAKQSHYKDKIDKVRSSFYWSSTQMELVEWIKESVPAYQPKDEVAILGLDSKEKSKLVKRVKKVTPSFVKKTAKRTINKITTKNK